MNISADNVHILECIYTKTGSQLMLSSKRVGSITTTAGRIISLILQQQLGSSPSDWQMRLMTLKSRAAALSHCALSAHCGTDHPVPCSLPLHLGGEGWGVPPPPAGKFFNNNLCKVSSSAFPAISLGFTILVRFCKCDHFVNRTTEVVTFHLHGWCMLGVFVASIHQSRTWISGSFESLWWNACVHRLDLGLNYHPKELLSQNPC